MGASAQSEAASINRTTALEREVSRLRLELTTVSAAANERSDMEIDAARRQNDVLERELVDLRAALTRISVSSPPGWERRWEHGFRESVHSPEARHSPDRTGTPPFVPPSPAYSFTSALPMPALTDAAKLLDTRLDELRRFVASPAPPPTRI